MGGQEKLRCSHLDYTIFISLEGEVLIKTNVVDLLPITWKSLCTKSTSNDTRLEGRQFHRLEFLEVWS